MRERWRLGYLIDTIYLRDLWMHREFCRTLAGRAPATGLLTTIVPF